MGREGGNAVYKKYGRKHMQEIGARGFAATCAKWFGGDKEACMNYLHLQATERQINSLLDERMAQTGETCVELPIILSPDDDVFFEEPALSWRERVKTSRRKQAQEIDLPF